MKLKTDLTQDQLDQLIKLVTFTEDEDGKLRICNIYGDVEGYVGGNVLGGVTNDTLDDGKT